MGAMEALHELFCELFPTYDELQRFVGVDEEGRKLVRDLPQASASMNQVVSSALAEFRRRGLLPVVFRRLCDEFPRRFSDIQRVARRLRIELRPRVVKGEPRSVAATSHTPPWRWLHLSDLHIGSRTDEEWSQLLDDFWHSLEVWLPVVGAPDLVFMTGDLTSRGSPEEFARLTKFVDDLLGRLPKTSDGAAPLIVPVPGNHDLQRPQGRDARAYRVLRDYEDELDDPDVELLREELWGQSDASFLHPLFANYLQWFDTCVRPRSVRPGVSLRVSHFPGDLSLLLASPGRFPLGIVGLNSAWSWYGAGAESLVLAREQLYAALGGDGDDGVLDQAHRALLVMHHPRARLSRQSRQIFDADIHPEDRFTACLHGSMHEPGAINTPHDAAVPRCFYQGPSLFGRESYGSPQAPRAIGYTWGALFDDGELQVWPLRWQLADGTGMFDRDPALCSDAPAMNVVMRRGDGKHWRPRSAATGPQPNVSVAEPTALLAYRTWLFKQRPSVELIGVGGGEMQLALEAVYVPLRVMARAQPSEAKVTEACEIGDFDVDALFKRASTQHALILGEPGSGKTTALHKLGQRCARDGGEALGLDPGTVPVWLRLRRFTAERLSQPIAEWLQDELLERSRGELPAELGAALWQHGRLLVLADGFDEVAKEGLRGELSRYLRFQLSGAAASQVRTVVTCRFAGYRRSTQLDARFAELELRPLGVEQVRSLVRRWFNEASRVMSDLSLAAAQSRAEGLITVIDGPQYSSQRLKVMVSTPLFLTLLCVIVNQGREMPRSRVAYYERCLEVLLVRWNQIQRGREPPLDLSRALAVLRPLAYALHVLGERDARLRGDIVVQINQRLRSRGMKPNGIEVVDWLQRDAGILREFSPEYLGIVHLGLQEYLAAEHIGSEGDALLDDLAGRLEDPWWHEVARLVVALRGSATFGPLMRRVLRAPTQQGNLIADLFDEASEAEPTPLLERLAELETPRDMATLLRILRRFARDPKVQAAARPLAEHPDVEVRALALQFEESREEIDWRRANDLILIFAGEQRALAEELASALMGSGVRLFRDEQGRLPDALELQSDLTAAVEAAPCALALSGPSGPAWAEPSVVSSLALLSDAGKKLAWGLLGDEPAVPWPAELRRAERIDLRAPSGRDELQRWLAVSRTELESPIISPGLAFVEPVTGIRFLWVPGGRFRMGMAGVAEPLHWVRLSPYWLAETPVTNAQYAAFLHDSPRKEPGYWRDRRFSGESHPVVGVNWDDAMAFAAWMSDKLGLAARGVVVTPPTEAQWEFAARGSDGRTFPWGEQPPDATRAVYGRRNGFTQRVEGCPAGQGPFGHFDMAGNVWEWCLDVFDEEAYSRRGPDEVVDPVDVRRDEPGRVLRGGAWWDPADMLRCAVRYGISSWVNGIFGLRVAGVWRPPCGSQEADETETAMVP